VFNFRRSRLRERVDEVRELTSLRVHGLVALVDEDVAHVLKRFRMRHDAPNRRQRNRPALPAPEARREDGGRVAVVRELRRVLRQDLARRLEDDRRVGELRHDARNQQALTAPGRRHDDAVAVLALRVDEVVDASAGRLLLIVA
jgi:hypothetical protein